MPSSLVVLFFGVFFTRHNCLTTVTSPSSCLPFQTIFIHILYISSSYIISYIYLFVYVAYVRIEATLFWAEKIGLFFQRSAPLVSTVVFVVLLFFTD